MKKMVLMLALVLVGSSTFASNGVLEKEINFKKEVETEKTSITLKKNRIAIYCDGVYVGYYECNSCTMQELLDFAYSVCN